MLLVGPRGMGKTTLGLRFLHAVKESPDLARNWQPVPFHEESYGIGDIAEFWLAALRHLTRATGNPLWEERADALAREEGDSDRLAAYALAALSDHCRASGKRLILFVENLDAVLEQVREEREIHALRATLIARPEILLVGSANAVFDAVRNHGRPFYEFFRLILLEGLGPDETGQLLMALARRHGSQDASRVLDFERGRLETIRRLTGGNPRLLALTCRMLIESPLGPPFEDLEQLIDEQTPYFKARIEALPNQARRVFHYLAEGWQPMLAREVADAAKLSSSHASAQIRQLVEKGYAREIRLPEEKRARYEVGDRFYNIYYLMRFSRDERQRLERLVAFLHELFGTSGKQRMYFQFLDLMRTLGSRFPDAADWLETLAAQVASDSEFPGRDDWRWEALELARNLLGPSSPVAERIQVAFKGKQPAKEPGSKDSILRGADHFEAGRYREAQAAFRDAVEAEPENLLAWNLFGYAQIFNDHDEDALATFELVLDRAPNDGEIQARALVASATAGRGYLYRRLKSIEVDLLALDRVLKQMEIAGPAWLRRTSLAAWRDHCVALAERRRRTEAIELAARGVELVSPDDTPEIREIALTALLPIGLMRHPESSGNNPFSETLAAALAIHSRLLVIVRSDDPPRMRRWGAGYLAIVGHWLNTIGKYRDAEDIGRKMTEWDPEYDRSWQVLLDAILQQGDRTRLPEVEEYARRVVELTPKDPNAHGMLSDILACLGRWPESLDLAQRALHLDREGKQPVRLSALTDVLVSAVVAGYGVRVKQMMEEFDLAGFMEPLWHAVREELGERIGPLPAEILDAVNEIRARIAEERKIGA